LLFGHINRVFKKITSAQEFTGEQTLWRDRIRGHLISNLSIDQDDFTYMPAFENAGGWRKANKVCQGQLADLLKKLNAAIAA